MRTLVKDGFGFALSGTTRMNLCTPNDSAEHLIYIELDQGRGEGQRVYYVHCNNSVGTLWDSGIWIRLLRGLRDLFGKSEALRGGLASEASGDPFLRRQNIENKLDLIRGEAPLTVTLECRLETCQ